MADFANISDASRDQRFIGVAQRLMHDLGLSADQARGVAIVMRALEEPLRQIAYNAGDEPSVVLDRLQDAGNVGSILRSAAASTSAAVGAGERAFHSLRQAKRKQPKGSTPPALPLTG